MTTVKKHNTSTTNHPLRNGCTHKGYTRVKAQWNVGGKFRECECTNCEATWTEERK